mgnify:CR=1 FL=1
MLNLLPLAAVSPPLLPALGVFSLIIILMAVTVGDRLIVRGMNRFRIWLTPWFKSQPSPWLELSWSLLQWGLRLGLWVTGVIGVLLLPASNPLQRWLLLTFTPVVNRLTSLLSTPLFTLGKATITLTSLFTLMVVSLALVLLSRWLRNWIKQRVLTRLGLDRGNQEAIAGVIGYLFTALGIIIVLQTIGIDLSSLAVLAGVLGIGLGFAFQQLASNFISGLTLLVEQPIKVGDFIEVDGLLGTVEKISIRSTVLRTNDNLCVIVPNNRFLERNVVNWSYASPKSRIHLPVGVAFGSDTVLVTEALLAAARQDARVLSHPAPSVWFKRFGDSAYEFELLVWIDEPKDFEPIKSALNFLVEQELSYRGIEIPFPQRELRVRHTEELRLLFNPPTPPVPPSPAPPSHPPIPPPQAVQSSFSAPGQFAQDQTLRVLLRKVAYFANCSDAELRVLIERGYQKFFRSGQVIFRANQPGDTFYIILSGSVEVLSEGQWSPNQAETPPLAVSIDPKATFIQVENQVLATLGKGDFFGEISLLTGALRSATVRAVEDTILFVVDRNALQKLLQEYQELAERIAIELAQRQQVLRELGLLNQEDESNLVDKTPLQRIRQRLQTLFSLSDRPGGPGHA